MTLESVRRDFVYAFHALRKEKGLACVAVFTLALGIGANTAIFSVIHAVLLKPLDYPDADRLVQMGNGTPARFELMKSATRTFIGMGASTGSEDQTLITPAQPVVLKAARVSAGFLHLLGVFPLLGRDFSPQEDSPAGAPVALISAELWQRHFNGDTHVLGQTLNLGSGPYTIIGVLPARFQFPSPGLDVWLPRPQEWPIMPAKSRAISPFLGIFGRIKPSATMEQANAEIAVIQHQYAASHPTFLDAKPKSFTGVKAFKERMVEGIRSTLWMLFGAVGFVLLIACANVASLLLARASARSREIAVRAALGASRGRLMAQLLAESLVLSAAGGVVGLLLATAALGGVRTITAVDLPRAGEIHIDSLVLAFAAAVSIFTGILFGLVPSFSASRPNIIGALRAKSDLTSASSPRRTRLGFSARGILVVAQVALSVVLLIGAALLIQSIIRLRAENPGFNPAQLLTARISLPPSRYDTDQKKRAFVDELIAQLRRTPGIRAVGGAMTLPMTTFAGTPVQDASKPILKLNERLIAKVNIVTSDYFHTLQIPMRRGRDFNERDKQGTQRVVIVDENLARYFWPAYPHGLDPIGQYILVGGVNPLPAQIIGIVANVHQNVENVGWPESVYLAFAQGPTPNAMLALRTEGDPTRYASTIRQHVQAIDRDQPISEVENMESLVEAELGQRRLLVKLLGFFAAVALTLSLVGIYGVISYSVTQRTYEMGIRRAVGAQDGHILQLIVGQAMGLAITGTMVGIACAIGLTRVMKTLLFHVSTTDPVTFAGIAVLFLAVALAASFFPARRATRIDPMAAFRYE
ncbi:MAG TPA: ABC transporter permease [Bryobacteraceae bacterium]|nr:ABC transporter permease [Bryobacteraceae bacterium]